MIHPCHAELWSLRDSKNIPQRFSKTFSPLTNVASEYIRQFFVWGGGGGIARSQMKTDVMGKNKKTPTPDNVQLAQASSFTE